MCRDLDIHNENMGMPLFQVKITGFGGTASDFTQNEGFHGDSTALNLPRSTSLNGIRLLELFVEASHHNCQA